MKDSDKIPEHDTGPAHSLKIDRAARRRLKAQQEKSKGIWYGMGMLGLVGWSVSIPTLLGVALGIWIDRHWPSSYSWTLMLLLAGLMVGCLNSWYWVKKTGQDD
ncbi:AtpZ/AtpI family protein [uncultured Desulfobulbus sp.]|uniref:AtpZ/AtpI family protein n=1 Tax=uncultured Desulfobulbus sp. TaxID=239745 RepID=UPI0029C67311|nr:AtpZ/AtpI family protein [uncultured Desulfobulbus sp.]